MYRYGQYCPVARAAEILADRWTVLTVRELLADINRFNDLERGLPHISRAVLVERLRRLERAGVLQRRVLRGKQTEYRLTSAGRELQQLIGVLGEWGARWAFGDPRSNELDPIVLLWWIRRRIALDSIPRRRVVIELDFRGGPRQKYWLLIEPTDASICLKHPGFEIDLIVTADIKAFYRVWLSHSTLSEALRGGQVHLDGVPADVRAFPRWFTWSPMADTLRAALKDRGADATIVEKTNDRQEYPVDTKVGWFLTDGKIEGRTETPLVPSSTERW
jgi:DNA-binding HxlR family transcriptional regulator